MKKTYALLTIMATALFVAGCNKNASAPVPAAATASDSNEIIFSSDYNLQYNIETKATAVTSLSSFNVSAVTGSAGSETAVWTNASFTDAGESRYAGDKYWPLTNDNPYRFYASNATLSYAATGATVTVDTGTDVVCDYLSAPTYKDVNALAFDHIFARIGDVTVSAATGYTITGVSISITPKTSGTFNLLTGDGETDGTGWSDTSNGSAYALANATPGTKSNDLYLIPGTYTLTATWTATRGEYTQTFSNKTYDVAIVGGKINSISTTLGGLAEEIKFTVTVNPWGSNGVVAEFPLVEPANGHDYVDLGLRVGSNKILFATMNIGASSPEEYGDYFAWGETSKRYTSISGNSVVGGSFDYFNCPYHTGNTSNTGWSKYIPTGSESYTVSGTADNKLVLDASDDVASALWGGSWRMPTPEELCMLINGNGTSTYCDEANNVTYSWTSNYSGTGVHGYIITGKGSFSSASLFLPAAGYCGVTDLLDAGDYGYYWSRSVYSGNPHCAWSLYFGDGDQSVGINSIRCYGRSVRPVLVLPL